MAFTDPQSLTINAVPYSLPRVSVSGTSSIYQDVTQNVKMTVSHASAKRNRSLLRVDFQKTAPDPLISSTNIIYSMSVAMTVDRPLVGFTAAEAKQVVDAFAAYLTASSGANTTKFLGFES